MQHYDACIIGGCSIDISINQSSDGSYNEKKAIINFGGKGANQAVACARAGAKVCIISKVGDDAYGDQIINNLKNNNVTTYISKEKNKKSDFSKVFINLHGDNDILRSREVIDSFTTQYINEHIDVIKNSDYIVLQLKMPIEVTKYIIELCYSLNKKIVLTPCTPTKLIANEDNNLNYIEKLSYICCNEKECKTLFSCEYVEEAIMKAPCTIVTTLGPRGLIYKKKTELCHLDQIDIDEYRVDTTGAGDTFCGNLVAFLSQGELLDKAIEHSQYASAYKITIPTAQKGMPTKKQLNKFIKDVTSGQFKPEI